MADSAAQQKLLQARDLIQQQRYTEARDILVTVNHPKATEWLAKIDQIAPQTVNSDNDYNDEPDWLSAARPTDEHPLIGSYNSSAPARTGISPSSTSSPLIEPVEPIGSGSMIGGIIGGIIGMLLGGAIWAAVAIFTEREFGLIAIALGFITGFGAALGSGRRPNTTLAIIAAVLGVGSVIVGKFIFYQWDYNQAVAEFGAELVGSLGVSFTDFIITEPLDAVWLVLAAITAFSGVRSGAKDAPPRKRGAVESPR